MINNNSIKGILLEVLQYWSDKNNKLGEFQVGFKKNYTTVGNTFFFTGLIKYRLRIVDFSAAFDQLNRNFINCPSWEL